MRTFSILAVAAALLVTPLAVQNAAAQVELSFGGGLNSPLGDFSDEVNKGWVFTTGVGYQIVPVLVVGLEVGFFGNNASDEILAGLSPGSEVSTRIQQYAGFAKVVVPVGKYSVFGKGMVGSYRGIVNYSGPLGDTKAENTDPGYGLGGGFMIDGNHNTSFFFDVMYHHVSYDDSTSDTNFMSFDIGGVFRVSLFD